MAGEVDRSKFELVFGDDFTGDTLDTGRWIDHYLRQWTTPERSAARYALNGRGSIAHRGRSASMAARGR